MTSKNQPLVSCLCVTHNKVALLKRSVECFFNQTYPNKELVLVYMADNVETKAFINQLTDSRIVCHELPNDGSMTLGEKRNLSIEKSNGFYFCVWDDDDWHNPYRIERQVEDLSNSDFGCSVLSSLLIYDTDTQTGFVSSSRAWEQTMLCAKSLIDYDTLRYAHLDRGEDTILIEDLKARDLVSYRDDPGLYIYIYHGKNTWHRQHWQRNVMSRGEELSPELSVLLTATVNGMHTHEEAGLVWKDFHID